MYVKLLEEDKLNEDNAPLEMIVLEKSRSIFSCTDEVSSTFLNTTMTTLIRMLVPLLTDMTFLT